MTTFVEFDTEEGVVRVRKDHISVVQTNRTLPNVFFVHTVGGRIFPVLGTPDALFAAMAGNDAVINTPAGDA